jgi:hypothetical protein
MNAGTTAFACVVAVVASVLAILAGTDVDEAVPAAAVAVGAAAFLLVGVVEHTRWPRGRPMPTLEADPARVRSSFGSGANGRPALVSLLDALDRTQGNPNLASTHPDEIARLKTLPPQEFRAYLETRVRELEGRQ